MTVKLQKRNNFFQIRHLRMMLVVQTAALESEHSSSVAGCGVRANGNERSRQQ